MKKLIQGVLGLSGTVIIGVALWRLGPEWFAIGVGAFLRQWADALNEL